MSDFYCRNCAAGNGWLNFTKPTNPTGTPYQLEKYIKHTKPTATYPINSVLHNPSAYHGYMIGAYVSGCVEVDRNGRITLDLDVGTVIGETHRRGVFERFDDAVKVLLPYAPHRVHLIPTASKEILNGRCARCGGPLT